MLCLAECISMPIPVVALGLRSTSTRGALLGCSETGSQVDGRGCFSHAALWFATAMILACPSSGAAAP
jgi:hypothetical protein